MSRSETLFISDCHLDVSRPDITQNFVSFIKTRASKARVLYILGDLFEVWLGDDDPAEDLAPIFDCLYHLSKTTHIYFMVGNRDFLVGQQLANKLNFTLLNEPKIITLNHQATALLHGDSLCTDDIDYQAFRNQVRSQKWQTEFLHKPLSERQSIAKKLRMESAKATKQKDLSITDVNQNSVFEYFESHNVTQIIHGHTHRPAIHHYTLHNKTKVKRFVLGDWQPSASYLSCLNDEISLHDKRVI